MTLLVKRIYWKYEKLVTGFFSHFRLSKIVGLCKDYAWILHLHYRIWNKIWEESCYYMLSDKKTGIFTTLSITQLFFTGYLPYYLSYHPLFSIVEKKLLWVFLENKAVNMIQYKLFYISMKILHRNYKLFSKEYVVHYPRGLKQILMCKYIKWRSVIRFLRCVL